MSDATLKLPRPPSGLKQAGRALWRGITADFDLRADERAALEAACRTADDLDRLTIKPRIDAAKGRKR